MNLFTWVSWLAVGLFAAMLTAIEVGFRLGLRDESHVADAHEGVGVIEAAIFALLGLLLGFSFSGATSRLDSRRDLIVHEANAIGSAYLWLDVLPAPEQPAMRRSFRAYLEARIQVYDNASDVATADRHIDRAAELQKEIWTSVVAAGQKDPSQNTTRLLLPAIVEMIDVTTARTVALRTYLPTLIVSLLISVAVLSAFVAGYAMSKRRRRSALHAVLFAASVSVTVYTVFDLDNPRFGLIRLDAAEDVLRELHASIRP